MWLCAGVVHAAIGTDVRTTSGTQQNNTVLRMQQQAANAVALVEAKECTDVCMREVRAILQRIVGDATLVTYGTMTTVDGMRAISTVITDAVRTATAVVPRMHDVRIHLVRMQLAFDALHPNGSPLWRSFGDVLHRDAHAWWQTTNKAHAWMTWRAHVDLVRPAIIVGRGMDAVAHWDAALARIAHVTRTRSWSAARAPWEHAVHAQQSIFSPAQPTGALPIDALPVASTIAFFAMLIFGAFLYFGFFSYRKMSSRTVKTYVQS
jgi:hypothetical protein